MTVREVLWMLVVSLMFGAGLATFMHFVEIPAPDAGFKVDHSKPFAAE
jgi:hypothetical protein